MVEIKSETVTKKLKKKDNFIAGTGRRKTSVARVFLYEKKGEFIVNGKDIKDYFPSEKETVRWNKPFHILGISHPTSKFSASIKVRGSGKSAQLDAVTSGLSKALAELNPEWSVILRKNSLITRDPRMVERKKYNLHKARKAIQYSKR